ncbi:hypothetical protein JW859_07845 [bacterium]|nr:hypothetical protein [bacterium]
MRNKATWILVIAVSMCGCWLPGRGMAFAKPELEQVFTAPTGHWVSDIVYVESSDCYFALTIADEPQPVDEKYRQTIGAGNDVAREPQAYSGFLWQTAPGLEPELLHAFPAVTGGSILARHEGKLIVQADLHQYPHIDFAGLSPEQIVTLRQDQLVNEESIAVYCLDQAGVLEWQVNCGPKPVSAEWDGFGTYVSCRDLHLTPDNNIYGLIETTSGGCTPSLLDYTIWQVSPDGVLRFVDCDKDPKANAGEAAQTSNNDTKAEYVTGVLDNYSNVLYGINHDAELVFKHRLERGVMWQAMLGTDRIIVLSVNGPEETEVITDPHGRPMEVRTQQIQVLNASGDMLRSYSVAGMSWDLLLVPALVDEQGQALILAEHRWSDKENDKEWICYFRYFVNSDGELAWKGGPCWVDIGGPCLTTLNVYGISASIDHAGTLYYVDSNNMLIALDRDGEERWRIQGTSFDGPEVVPLDSAHVLLRDVVCDDNADWLHDSPKRTTYWLVKQ